MGRLAAAAAAGVGLWVFATVGFSMIAVWVWVDVDAFAPAVCLLAFTVAGAGPSVYLLRWLPRRWRRAFDVTADSVVMGYLDRHGRVTGPIVWRRADVTAVKFHPYGGRLPIRVVGRERQEHAVGHRPATARVVADLLSRAVLGGGEEGVCRFGPTEPTVGPASV